MAGNSASEIAGIWLATAPANLIQRRLTLAAIAILLLCFVTAASFANVALPPSSGFIPYIQAAMSITDFITALLLFTQFAILRLRALLVLANGYLFTALIIVSHTLAFPGAFAPEGILGAGLQTTGWLHIIWHFVFPATSVIYALMKNGTHVGPRTRSSTTATIFCSLASVIGIVVAITWSLIVFDAYVPRLILDKTSFAPLAVYTGWLDALVCAVALVLLWLRQGSVLDRWLMVAIFATFVEMLMLSFITGRYNVGWYSVRVFGFVSSSVVLMALLMETTKLYAQLADVTRRLERERDNKLLNAQAITASLAHEVRQPLTGITTSAGAARRFLATEPPDIDRAQIALSRVVTASHRVSEVFDSLRVLFGKVNQSRQPVDLNRIVTDVAQSLQDEFRNDLVITKLELLTDLPLVSGNGGQLREVVANLVRNALEAMQTPPKRIRILKVATERRGTSEIEVSVRDTGPGIAPERLSDIFTAFATTKVGGTGLGLAICRMIVEHHGGQLTASSDGVNGSLFRFVLPIEASS